MEFGLNLAQGFATCFSGEFRAGIAIHALHGNQVEILASTISGTSLVSQQNIMSAWQEEEVQGRQQTGGTRYATLVRCIAEFSGRPIAVVDISMDRSFDVDSMAGTRTFVILLAVVAIAIALLVAFILAQSISGLYGAR